MAKIHWEPTEIYKVTVQDSDHNTKQLAPDLMLRGGIDDGNDGTMSRMVIDSGWDAKVLRQW
jgi:hypothetical protein